MSTSIKKQALCLSAAMLLGAMTLSGCQMNDLNETIDSINDGIDTAVNTLTGKDSDFVTLGDRVYTTDKPEEICPKAFKTTDDFIYRYKDKWIRATGTLEKDSFYYSITGTSKDKKFKKWRITDEKTFKKAIKDGKVGEDYTFEGQIFLIGGYAGECLIRIK